MLFNPYMSNPLIGDKGSFVLEQFLHTCMNLNWLFPNSKLLDASAVALVLYTSLEQDFKKCTANFMGFFECLVGP